MTRQKRAEVVVAVEDEDQQWRTIVDGRVASRSGGPTPLRASLKDSSGSLVYSNKLSLGYY